MIGQTNPAPQLVIIDLILLICAFPFIVCDFYYANKDFSCAWIDIRPHYNINFPLKTWLRTDGAMMLTFIVIMLIIALIICTSPGCECLYPVHAIFGAIISIFRFAWLIVGAVLFWGYLTKNGGLCAPNIRGYMFANLIIGFLLLPLFFVAAFLYTSVPSFVPNAALAVPTSVPTFRGANAPIM